MTSAYLQLQLKALDKSLKQYRTRQQRTEALETFEEGLKFSLWENYQKEFPQYQSMRKIYSAYDALLSLGTSLGRAFGPLEVQDAAETLFAEIEKRKARLAKPGMLERFTLFLKKADELVLISQNLRRYNHQKIL
jgi:hypothetical protein